MASTEAAGHNQTAAAHSALAEHMNGTATNTAAAAATPLSAKQVRRGISFTLHCY